MDFNMLIIGPIDADKTEFVRQICAKSLDHGDEDKKISRSICVKDVDDVRIVLQVWNISAKTK